MWRTLRVHILEGKFVDPALPETKETNVFKQHASLSEDRGQHYKNSRSIDCKNWGRNEEINYFLNSAQLTLGPWGPMGPLSPRGPGEPCRKEKLKNVDRERARVICHTYFYTE